MSNCKPCSTPIDTNSKLSFSAGPLVSSPTHYRSLVGALQYLTFTLPDIAYGFQQVCLHIHDLHEMHFNLIERILRYLKATLHYGLRVQRTSPSFLTAYSNANWAGCPPHLQVYFGLRCFPW